MAVMRAARQSPEIMVIPGIAGRWFLQVDEDQPKARVYRIDLDQAEAAVSAVLVQRSAPRG